MKKYVSLLLATSILSGDCLLSVAHAMDTFPDSSREEENRKTSVTKVAPQKEKPEEQKETTSSSQEKPNEEEKLSNSIGGEKEKFVNNTIPEDSDEDEFGKKEKINNGEEFPPLKSTVSVEDLSLWEKEEVEKAINSLPKTTKTKEALEAICELVLFNRGHYFYKDWVLEITKEIPAEKLVVILKTSLSFLKKIENKEFSSFGPYELKAFCKGVSMLSKEERNTQILSALLKTIMLLNGEVRYAFSTIASLPSSELGDIIIKTLPLKLTSTYNSSQFFSTISRLPKSARTLQTLKHIFKIFNMPGISPYFSQQCFQEISIKELADVLNKSIPFIKSVRGDDFLGFLIGVGMLPKEDRTEQTLMALARVVLNGMGYLYMLPGIPSDQFADVLKRTSAVIEQAQLVNGERIRAFLSVLASFTSQQRGGTIMAYTNIPQALKITATGQNIRDALNLFHTALTFSDLTVDQLIAAVHQVNEGGHQTFAAYLAGLSQAILGIVNSTNGLSNTLPDEFDGGPDGEGDWFPGEAAGNAPTN